MSTTESNWAGGPADVRARLNFSNKQRLAHHLGYRQDKEKAKGVQMPGPNGPHTSVHIVIQSSLPRSQNQYAGEQYARRNGGAFKVCHRVSSLRKILGSHIKPGQSAASTADKIEERDPVPPSAHTCGKPKRCGSDSKRDDV